MKKPLFPVITTVIILTVSSLSAQDQPRTPEIMSNGTMEEQLEYIQQRTNIYNNYRAIREDIFLNLKKNTLDSIKAMKEKVSELEKEISGLQTEIESGKVLLAKANKDLDHAVKNRNAILLLGIPMNKVLYNTIMWSLVSGLLIILVFLSILYLRNQKLKFQLGEEITELQEQFESHRKSTREKIEKMVVDHFNEIRKVKGER